MPTEMTQTPRPRDLRLDFFRGVGMFIILIAHITGNPWTLWIPARFGFSEATELFVFCSGMASALAFGAVFSRAGWGLGTLRILHRIWQVYWVHLGVFFVSLVLMLALDMTGAFPRDEVGALNLYPILTNTGPNLIGLLTLTYVPNYFDILPMYLVILGLIPVMMALARVDRRLVFLASAALWIAATAGLNLPAELWFSRPSDRPWFFNPFAWQLVFFTGFAVMAGWVPAPPVRRGLVWLAAAIVILSVPLAWSKIIGQIGPIRDLRRAAAPLFDKTDLGALRYVHFLALAYLAWVAVGPGGVRLQRGG
ncbi:MAG: OpgC domain-containing protein, partial [Sphingomonadales bacterium]|nr:OpgC domain-containing protein [Sphingomonadales bacterium]